MFYVYLLASRKQGTLYLGVTRDLVRRAYQHKSKTVPGFTSRYDVDRLVWFECYDDPVNAITRERKSRMAARMESSPDRERKSGLERFLSRYREIVPVSGFRVRAFGAPRNASFELVILGKRP